MRTHGHPIVVSLPACIYWNSYRTWRWAGSRWVLQYLQATASPAAILRLIGGHQPFLFALTLFGFSIYLPPSWSSIFILRHCWCQKNLPEKKLGTDVPFLFTAPFVIVWPMCNTNFLCLDVIYKKSWKRILCALFSEYQTNIWEGVWQIRRWVKQPSINIITNMISWTLGGCKIYLVKK